MPAAPVPGQPGAERSSAGSSSDPDRRLPLRPARLQTRRHTAAGAPDAGHGVRQRDGRQVGPGQATRSTEVPTTLRKDGRSRPPHLQHLARRLAPPALPADLQPALAIPLSRPRVADRGAARVIFLFPGDIKLGASTLGINTFIAACMAVLIGVQSITFAAVARRYATLRGLLPPSARYSALLRSLTPERLLAAGVVLFIVTLVGMAYSVYRWVSVGFGPLPDTSVLRVFALSLTGLVAAVQLWLVAFLASLMEIPQRGRACHEVPRSVPAVGAHQAWAAVREARRRGRGRRLRRRRHVQGMAGLDRPWGWCRPGSRQARDRAQLRAVPGQLS